MEGDPLFKVENFGVSWIDIELPFPCEIHHCTPRAQPSPNRYKVLSHYTEPDQLKSSPEDVRRWHSLFDLILTNDESLLDLSNARFAVFGSRWVDRMPNSKKFGVSFLYSGGIGNEGVFRGYRDRRILWSRSSEIQIEKSFYTSVTRPPGGVDDLKPYPYPDKNELFNSMFSVVIENDYTKNWFTEKIVDALSTYTIPIYLGCPNISKYFDVNGMILPDTVDSIPGLLNSLTPESYWSRIPYMLDNFKSSQKYWSFLDNMKGHILKAYYS